MNTYVSNGVVQANHDGKGLGKTINELALEGKVKAVTIVFDDRRKTVRCNSAWAATDWLKEQGFYTDQRPCNYQII